MLQLQGQASSSNVEAGKSLWNSIWELRVPNKVRHFVWRAVRNSLPTKLNLHKRQVCRDCLEDSIHALWYCDAVKAIWMSDARFSFLRTQKFSTFEDLVQFLCLQGSADLCARFAMVAWSIWWWRNRVRLKQKTWQVDEVVQRASELLREFWDVQKKGNRVVEHGKDLRWKPPDSGLYKINFDGALFADQGSAAIGVVIRDWEGQVIAALSEKVRHPGSVDLVEALATRQAISFAKELNIHQMVIEGDSLRVIQAINEARPVQTLYGHVVDDIRFLSSSYRCSFS